MGFALAEHVRLQVRRPDIQQPDAVTGVQLPERGQAGRVDTRIVPDAAGRADKRLLGGPIRPHGRVVRIHAHRLGDVPGDLGERVLVAGHDRRVDTPGAESSEHDAHVTRPHVEHGRHDRPGAEHGLQEQATRRPVRRDGATIRRQTGGIQAAEPQPAGEADALERRPVTRPAGRIGQQAGGELDGQILIPAVRQGVGPLLHVPGQGAPDGGQRKQPIVGRPDRPRPQVIEQLALSAAEQVGKASRVDQQVGCGAARGQTAGGGRISYAHVRLLCHRVPFLTCASDTPLTMDRQMPSVSVRPSPDRAACLYMASLTCSGVSSLSAQLISRPKNL